MNEIAKQTTGMELVVALAKKALMKPEDFETTIRTTIMPAKHNDAQFASLMMVAHQYGLNPILKEIYAFPAKGGGIVPIVSIDGWINLVNSHQQCNGFTFDEHVDDDGNLISITCTMHRKDRDHPIQVTEYLSECKRETEPWKMVHRMLRHKALIQCARYAFGFSGIYDEEEGSVISEASPQTVGQPPKSKKPPAPPADDEIVVEEEDQVEATEEVEQDSPKDILEEFAQWMINSSTREDVETAWDQFEHHQETLPKAEAATLLELYEKAVERVSEADEPEEPIEKTNSGVSSAPDEDAGNDEDIPISESSTASSTASDEMDEEHKGKLINLVRDLVKAIDKRGSTSMVSVKEQHKTIIGKFDKELPEPVLAQARLIYVDFDSTFQNLDDPKKGMSRSKVLAKWSGAFDMPIGVFTK